MKIIKSLFTASLAIIFIGTVFMSLAGMGKIIDSYMKAYVFNVGECRYEYSLVKEPGERQVTESKENCAVDYNRAKNRIAEGIGMMVALPIAFISFRTLRKLIKEV